MSYFVSKEVETNINQNLKNLIIESEKININLAKHQKELIALKKHFLFNALKGYLKKLEYLIAEEELKSKKVNTKINLYQEINIKIKSLLSSLYTMGAEKSIFNKEVYYECMRLYHKLTLDLTYLAENQNDVTSLQEINSFLEKINNFYGSINFNNPNFDYHAKINIDDFDLLIENSSLIDLIENCFQDEISYEEFILKTKKYLTLYELNHQNHKTRKIYKRNLA